jgi:F-type H+-transporting ATPase subunit epsilon
MAAKFHLEIITPNRIFYSDEVEMVIVHATDGYFGVMAMHTPMVMVLEAGPMKIKKDDKWIYCANSEGFMEVGVDKVIIFADTAEWPEEIDLNRALAAKERAEERLRKQLSHLEYIRSKAAIARAMARLRVTSVK